MLAAQQQTENDAERVHVRRRRHRLAAQLLRRRVSWREAGFDLARKLGRIAVEQRCNAEIEQLHLPVRRHENVRRFDVAMNDQMTVRVGDGGDDIEKQPYTFVDVQTASIGVTIDRRALDVLEHDIRLTCRSDACIDELCDLRMPQFREHGTFAHETLLGRSTDERCIEKLDRRSSFVATVAAMRKPHRPHAAMADDALERIGADPLPRQPGVRRRYRNFARQQRMPIHFISLGKHVSHCIRDLQIGEKSLPFARRQIERSIERVADLQPTFDVLTPHTAIERTTHGSSAKVRRSPAYPGLRVRASAIRAPCPNRAARCAPRRRALQQFRLASIRRRT
jgi:hypothetical protein